MTPSERATEILRAHGVPCHYEPFDGSIQVEDDGAYWHWGTVNEHWCADLMRDPSVGDSVGSACTDVPSDSTDPDRIAGAILAALHGGAGVTIWPAAPGGWRPGGDLVASSPPPRAQGHPRNP